MSSKLLSMLALTAILSIQGLDASSSLFSYEINATLSEEREQYGDELTCRFIKESDPSTNTVAGIPLQKSWWSRPHEYAWAAQFAGPDYVVLDAACGISHPFKWYLGQNCKSTWACDSDGRIASIPQIVTETYDDLGPEAYEVLTSNPLLYDSVNLVEASICNLPNSFPQFDRIFCISTLEHLDTKDQTDAFTNFAKFLNKGGLLVVTFDYPLVDLKKIFAIADAAGFKAIGDVDFVHPRDALTNSYLSIFRCVFVHKELGE